MEISKLTVDDGKAIQTLEGILKNAALQNIKPVECAAVASAVVWFSGLMKQYGAVWMAENKAVKPEEKVSGIPATPAPDAPLKVKAYNPGKVK